MVTILIWTIQLLLVPALSPLLIGVVRKMKARLQNRKGADIFQPYRDLWKLMHKDEVISEDASWVFRTAPYIIFGITMIVGASIPLFTTLIPDILLHDFLVIVYLLAIGTFFLALAGLDTGNAFGGFGSSREMVVAALAEGGFIFSFLVLALLSNSTNLFSIAEHVETLRLHSNVEFVSIGFAFFGFFIVLLAETGRYPFDNPSTHLELTMIHEAMILEYSGKRLALVEWAAANKFMIFLALGVNLFFPWGMANSSDFTDIIVSLALFLSKMLGFCLTIATLESRVAKIRFFRIPDILFTSFILCVIAIVIII
ncbi:MAG: NADH-quinone oxidoreductase subunit H [Candidatus Scalindua sp.]|nr:NADH-quinone oxidoreductase subunit H [Candidatus Scalindua sp.]